MKNRDDNLNKSVKDKILILVDNLRVGGIQRQVLDQMYFMSDSEISSVLLVFDEISTHKYSSFFKIEKDIIEKKNLKIIFTKPRIYQQIVSIRNLIESESITLVLDYTLSGSVKTRLAQIFSRQKVRIHCIVQQLASLSDPVQRYKRMTMAQFSTNLFANSVNYAKDWELYVNKNLITKLFLSKKLSVIRNGVYLPRLTNFNSPESKLGDVKNLNVRFIFLGRLRTWKGLGNLSKLDEILHHEASFLVITPDFEPLVVEQLEKLFGNRVEFMFGKTPNDYSPRTGDIHVYAVDYGEKFKVIESVSTNCLEMAIIGVPSLITLGGGDNWPELKHHSMLFEVNWDDLESISKAIISATNSYALTRDQEPINEVITVERSIEKHSLLS